MDYIHTLGEPSQPKREYVPVLFLTNQPSFVHILAYWRKENVRSRWAGFPTLSHEDIHADLSSKDEVAVNKTGRDSLRGKSVEEQLETMFELMRKYGVLK